MSIRLGLGLCCDGTPPPPTREWDTAGRAASGRYDVLVRVFFGSLPSPAMLRAASRALHTLVLPPVMLTLHPGQTLHLARLHIGDAIVCRTATHTIRWKATVANVNSTGSVVWDKQLQVNVTRRDSRILASCQRR